MRTGAGREGGICRERDLRYFYVCGPLEGWRKAVITEQRARADWAGQNRGLADEGFPDAEKIILVMDNLNTHSIAPSMKHFPLKERNG
jgi:hypothetical protein